MKNVIFGVVFFLMGISFLTITYIGLKSNHSEELFNVTYSCDLCGKKWEEEVPSRYSQEPVEVEPNTFLFLCPECLGDVRTQQTIDSQIKRANYISEWQKGGE